MLSPHPELEPLVPPVEPARPRVLAALGLLAAILGLVAACGGFVPALGVPAVIVGGVLLAIGLVLSIVALASRRQGGTGLGVAGVVVALLGGVVVVAALTVAMLWTGLTSEAPAATAATPDTPITATTPTEDPQVKEQAAQATAEKKFLGEARPQIRDIVKRIRPGATDAQIDGAYSDDILLLIGYSVLDAYRSGGDAAVEEQVHSLMSMRPGVFTKEQADQLVAVVLKAAEDHLTP